MSPARRTSRLAAVASLLVIGATTARSQVPPDASYLQFETEHFRVVFPEGMEPFARRAAASAEWAYGTLAEHFVRAPRSRVALVVTDHTDRPNASATPLPSNRIVLIAAPQIATRQLNYYESDWVDVAMAHELTHIFHLDRAAGIWSIGRFVFGRQPTFFPAFYQPRWVIEGLATYYESRLTGVGRAYGSTFNSWVRNDARADELRPVDAANGIKPTFPAASTPYAYGGLYLRAMAAEHGDSVVALLAKKGARRLPYTLNWASGSLYGQSLTGSWNDWRARLAEAAATSDDAEAARPLSGQAWSLSAPRFAPDGRLIAFSAITPRDDPAVVVVDAASGATVLRRRRNGPGGVSWAPDGSAVYHSQVEFVDRYTIYSDLYRIDLASGHEERLTAGARLSSPDLAPDGGSLVAVQTGNGTNRLVELDLETLTLRPITGFVPDVNWEHPRWSPDGRYIAAERWQSGAVLDLVVIDRDGCTVRRITRDSAGDITPAWSPDGRYLLWASDRYGSYDILAVEWARELAADGGTPPRAWRVTRAPMGASDPAVSPDGRWLAFVALYPDGLRVERRSFEPATWLEAGPGERERRERLGPPPGAGPSPGGEVHGYSPFPSLWPKAWTPFLALSDGLEGDLLGAVVTGTDDIRRHSYTLFAGWRIGLEKVEWQAAYRYAGLGDPVLGLTAIQSWDENLRTADGTLFTTVERERNVIVTADFLRPRQRSSFRISPGFGVQFLRFEPTGGVQLTDSTFTDLEALLGIGFSTARSYPRSVSPENGWSASLLLSHQRLADDFDRWEASAELAWRGFISFPVFGFAHHVLAGRLDLGTSYGRDRGAEIFELGGLLARPLNLGFGLAIGHGETYGLRGYPENVQVGDRIAAASLEYRFPLLLVGRGYGLWPLFLDRVSMSFFLDAGSAWFDADAIDVLASAGAELSIDLAVNYNAVFRFRFGYAQPFDRAVGDPEPYLATGLAF
ncbi:MAG: BamA/TamA family outer membrane protein [Gemmatimonadetes bacterium]|uniref:BamA/TamA family outer membrane protein n=1 Tax=Candidatus Kutchimonas denitrificans TaxID=3056748 RepID=A0AAE5CA94_9BACT|nr:BamA/TamA family outer membrane protein [Gemmatimonadota bacterium]NIR74342.1 BamA/TamA family outer membrane protein [Candidatus Kutchimonas denitrificans]NIS02593.1 BamA/TamA family outer membrane protein [Gemmatimonadota bacterium]NIT68468.1 BamA/TamA family outer membrane protein [Gemmatimonadota bacterium]NIU51945.1 BamA/TamA family outer membrane protein [Gemmatimonadota bacterium]